MKIAVCAFGSEGDARPYVALTRALRSAGHEAWLVARTVHQERAAQAGVPFRPSVEQSAGDEIDRIGKSMVPVMQTKSPLRQGRLLFDVLGPLMVETIPGIRRQTSDAEVIVHHTFDFPAFAVAEERGVPRISGRLLPSDLRTQDRNAFGVNLTRPLNRLSNRIARMALRSMIDPMANAVLRAAGRPERKDVYVASGSSPWLNLLAVSPQIVPPDSLWPSQVVQTGYWFLDLPGYLPPKGLADFVDSGPQPIVVTFGSMIGTDAGALTRLVVEAIGPRRAVIQSGWAGLGEGLLPPNIIRAPHVPHDWLFSKANCVVHHGGAGTTAAAVRAGVPQVIVPHLGDQPIWAERIGRAGLSGRPIPLHRLTSARLKRSLEQATSPQKVERAKSVGVRVRAEDGLGDAVRAIERAMKGRSAPTGA